MSTRWDALFETRPVSLIAHALEEVAKAITRDLAQWPPPIAEFDLLTQGKFGTLFAPDAPVPHPAIVDEAFRLAHWSLSREVDAYDDYLRNRRYLEKGIPESDRLALLFLVRWIEEQLLALGEATEGRIRRPDLLRCLERARTLVREGSGAG